ncbi:MAG: glycoside hydrolase family 36 protein [Acutalibacteraceae bacterium]
MDFTVTGGNKNAEIKLSKKYDGDILYLTINLTLPSPEIPEPMKINWSFSAKDCGSIWGPSTLDHGLFFNWGKFIVNSRLASWMPIEQLISNSGKNKLLIAVSDVDTPMAVKAGIHEEDATFSCEIELFTRPTFPVTEYNATVRLDMRDIPYYDSIYDAADWWENDCGYKAAYVPESAKMPMDSLWYSFHQQLDIEEILKECRASKELGLETVIIDDGWQTDDNGRGYAYCGDWEPAPSKVGDMVSLVDELHKIGMKVVLWYSVPFMGQFAARYDEFKDMLLDGVGNAGTSFALDPRYKKVRDYLVGVYENAVRDWHLDGLKLDFIDNFALKGKSLEFDERRDFQSLEQAIHKLMSDIKESLTAINPDILIEFRQSYVGPSIRKYGNMLRVGDCACDYQRNKSGVINLRLASGKTAVHSDMIMWNTLDTPENAALQFASILYGVPQVSVRVDKLPEEHYKMLGFYIDFWKKHKDVLLDGKLTAENPECNYSSACSTLGNKSVATVYSNPVVTITTDEAAVVNASKHQSLILKGAKGKAFETVNCMGETLSSGEVSANIEEIEVPTSGIIFVK